MFFYQLRITLVLFLNLFFISSFGNNIEIFENSCEFSCINGHCDTNKRICLCSPGWLGAGCELCILGFECEIPKPKLSLILPQEGSLNEQNNYLFKYIYAFGNDFPKENYLCNFGNLISIRGKWINNSLIRCEFPSNIKLEPAKLAFSLTNLNTKQLIENNQNWPMTHFTFSPTCLPLLCKGNCFGPLCLCPYKRIGLYCNQTLNNNINLTTIIFNNSIEINNNNEFIPLIIKLPIEINSSIINLNIESDIKEIKLDLFKNIIYWISPFGRSKPYSIKLKINENEENYKLFNWTIQIKQSYSVELNKNLKELNKTNAKELNGKIKLIKEIYENNLLPFAFNSSIPILLYIYFNDYSGKSIYIEDLIIWTENKRKKEEKENNFFYFNKLLYPYLGIKEKINIIAKHPGDSSSNLNEYNTNKIEWIQEYLEINNFIKEIKLKEWNKNNKTLILNYSLKLFPFGYDCINEWKIEIIEPRELILIIEKGKIKENNLGIYKIKLKLKTFLDFTINEEEKEGEGISLRIMFMCIPNGQSVIIEQKLFGLILPEKELIKTTEIAKLTPKRLFINLNKNPTNIILLNIYLPNKFSNQLQKNNLKESELFSPFTIVWINKYLQNNWNIWLKLKNNEIEKYKNSLNIGGNIDGAILIKGTENLILSIPYRIQKNIEEKEEKNNNSNLFLFTLIIKGINNNINNNNLINVQLYIPTQFGPLYSDIFQLNINSYNYITFNKLIRINPLDNVFIVELIPKPLQYFTFDGKQLNSEWQIEINKEKINNLFIQPIVYFNPSIFSFKSFSKFIDVIYIQGPSESFVIIKPGWSSKQIIDFPLFRTNTSLCLGCGFRQLIKLNKQNEEEECNALAILIPFLSIQPIGHSPTILDFSQYFLFNFNEINENKEINNNNNKFLKIPKICYQKEENEINMEEQLPIALRTYILNNCPLSNLRICQQFYFPTKFYCQNRLNQIFNNNNTNNLSIYSIIQFILLYIDCFNNLEEIIKLINCLNNINWNCPLHPIELEMIPHFEGQIYNQIGYTKPLKYSSGLDLLFPSLNNILEKQLINFPIILSDFIKQLKKIFPKSLIILLNSEYFYNQFILAISNNSINGSFINLNEFNIPIEESSKKLFINNWNYLVNLLNGNYLEILKNNTKDNLMLNNLKELIIYFNHLKTITKQFGEENPFLLFKNVIKKIFENISFNPKKTNITAEGDIQEQKIAWADVIVEPLEIIEGLEFSISVIIQTSQSLINKLELINLNLRFIQSNHLKFRIGPIFNSQKEPINLNPGERLKIEWIIVPVPEFKLTSFIEQEVQLIELRPNFVSIGNENKPSPIDFKIENINLESLDETGNINEELIDSLSFGQILSGKASHMFLNLSLKNNDNSQSRIENSLLFRSFSAIISVNGKLLPVGQFEQKFFLIHESTHNNQILIVSEYSNPFPLYLFSKKQNSLTPLTTLQLIEEKQFNPKINGKTFITRIFVLRRLSLLSTLEENEQNNNKINFGAIFASINVETNQIFGNGIKLLKITEIGQQGKRRQIDMNLVWIGKISNEKTTLINFIDLDASAAIPQLIYELLFGLPEHFNSPFFSQSFYQLNFVIPIKTNNKQKVLARINAISPTNRFLKYSLLSMNKNNTISIVPSTGDIVLTGDLLEPFEYCLNIAATDTEGYSTQAILQINVLNKENSVGIGGVNECKIFNEENTLFNHEFKPQREEEEKDFEYFITPSPSLIFSSEPSIIEKPIFVHQIPSDDSTLFPLTTLKEELVTVGEALIDKELINENGTEDIYSLASTSIPQQSIKEELTFNHLKTEQTTIQQPSGSFKISGGGIGTRIGQIPARKINGTMSGHQGESSKGGGDMSSHASATTMAEMACRLRSTKPIWALICDMAKTVYRTTMINA